MKAAERGMLNMLEMTFANHDESFLSRCASSELFRTHRENGQWEICVKADECRSEWKKI